jgi:hypothetical protein
MSALLKWPGRLARAVNEVEDRKAREYVREQKPRFMIHATLHVTARKPTYQAPRAHLPANLSGHQGAGVVFLNHSLNPSSGFTRPGI